MPQKPSLLNIGSIAFDSIETPFGKVRKTLGGSASYFSLAASYFIKPTVVGVVGNDFNHFHVLEKHGVDISGLEQKTGKTFHWAGRYGFDLNTRDTLKTELGVFADFKPKLNPAQKSAKYIFLGNIHPKLQLDVLKQIIKPELIGLDTMNLWIETSLQDLKKVIARIDIFIINDSEARQLSQEHNIYKAAKKILVLMGKQKNDTLVIKRGEYGLLMFSQGKIFHLPGLPLEDVIDPTGAGDSFAGGFFGYLAKIKKLSVPNFKQACVYGSVMASFCVQNFGTKQLSNISDAQIKQRIKQLNKLILAA